MNKILKQWDTSLTSDSHQHLDINYQRRCFLFNSLKLASAIPVLPFIAGLSSCSDVSSNQYTSDPWLTIGVVSQHLFPDDGNGPSASDINSIQYLDFVLNVDDTDKDEIEFIYKGVTWLNQYCQSEYNKDFHALTHAQQDAAMHAIAASQSGERWLSYLLLYIFEALLSDPIYGGNPEGIGWQWLQHQPGFPQPGASQRYTELLKK